MAQLIGGAFLWHSQQQERISHRDVSLVVLAPSINEVFREEVRALGCNLSEQEPGIFRIEGLPFAIWLVETDEMAKRGQPILSLVSGVFLNQRQRTAEELKRTGHGPLLWYVVQQIQQFRTLGEEFAMQHRDTPYMGELDEELQTAVLDAIPPEKLRRRLTPEQRLRGVSPEDRVTDLSEEELARFRDVLERKRRE